MDSILLLQTSYRGPGLSCIYLLCVCILFAMSAYSVDILSVGGSIVGKNNLFDLPRSSVLTSGKQLATAEELSSFNSSRYA